MRGERGGGKVPRKVMKNGLVVGRSRLGRTYKIFEDSRYEFFFSEPRPNADERFGLGVRQYSKGSEEVEGWFYFDAEDLRIMLEKVQSIMEVRRLAGEGSNE